jgi:glycosyltransferase involved in cell wall biosynthesis
MRVLAVTNIYPTPARPSLGTFVEQQVNGLRAAGMTVEVLYVDRREQGMATYLRVPDRLRSALRTFDADVVHVMYGGVMADIVTRTIHGRPIVVTFHGSDLLGEKSSRPLRRILAQLGVMSSWRAARRAAAVVVVANHLTEALPRDLDRGKIRVIPCGIDLARFVPLPQEACRRQLGWDADAFYVAFNSNGGNPVKRPALARAAVEILNRNGIRAVLMELRGMSNTEVPIWLNASDALVLTSRHEGSPTIVKEALACNVPVVSVDVGDVRERIAAINGCYLVAADPDDIADKLQRALKSTRRVDGRLRMAEMSIERIASRLKQLYEEVAGRAACRLAWQDEERPGIRSASRTSTASCSRPASSG